VVWESFAGLFVAFSFSAYSELKPAVNFSYSFFHLFVFLG